MSWTLPPSRRAGVQVVTYPATIDLLPLIDPKLDVFDGEVQSTEAGFELTNVLKIRPRIAIPVRPLGAYELTVRLSRATGHGRGGVWVADDKIAGKRDFRRAPYRLQCLRHRDDPW